MASLFHLLITQPLTNVLVFLYETIAFKDLGVAIILLTVLIRLVLHPLFAKSIRHQAAMQKIQPSVKKIQETHKNDKAKQTEAMLALYREHRVNPLSGFLLLALQIPVLIALYKLFLMEFTPANLIPDLYSFVPHPEATTSYLFGLINLKTPSILMVGLAAATQYFQARMAATFQKDAPKEMQALGKKMAFIGPILTILIFFRFPAAVSLYWFVSSLFGVAEQYRVYQKINGKPNPQLESVSRDPRAKDGVSGV